MSFPDLSQESIAAWDTNAAAWDDGVGEHGNKYWKSLQEPSLARLLGPLLQERPGCRALELACGNGLCSRWLAARGARVLATDGSTMMLGHAARRVPEETEDAFEFRKLDVTAPRDFEAILQRADTPVCSHRLRICFSPGDVNL